MVPTRKLPHLMATSIATSSFIIEEFDISRYGLEILVDKIK